jgi:hypothetical protein
MKTLTAAIALAILVSSPVFAQKIHRWVDKDGNVHFGQSVPPEYADQIEGNQQQARSAPAEAVQSSYSEEELARRKEEARQRDADMSLLRTYLSVEEIETVRDKRIDQVEARNFVTERYLASLHDQLEAMETEAADYEAANSKPGEAAQLPPDLERDMASTRASITDYEGRLEKGRAEQERIREKFAADIARFRELKGLPPAPAE